jgi:hypothetical protein
LGGTEYAGKCSRENTGFNLGFDSVLRHILENAMKFEQRRPLTVGSPTHELIAIVAEDFSAVHSFKKDLKSRRLRSAIRSFIYSHFDNCLLA